MLISFSFLYAPGTTGTGGAFGSTVPNAEDCEYTLDALLGELKEETVSGVSGDHTDFACCEGVRGLMFEACVPLADATVWR